MFVKVSVLIVEYGLCMKNKFRSLVSILILTLISIGITIPTFSETWRDDFDTPNPDAWNIVGNDDVWTVKDGFLRIHVNRDWEINYDLFQFIAIPGPYRDFTVKIEDFGGDKLRFGLCVGRQFPDTPDEELFYYVFFPNEIRARRFDGKGISYPFHYRLSREPRMRWDTDVLNTLELHFNSGNFLLFTDGEFRTKFRDKNFSRIEIIGFVVEGINIANQWEADGWIDSFTLSGLHVSPEVKTTSLWSQLKSR